nr:hypothetical protein [Tanacetum cinerariifolium]
MEDDVKWLMAPVTPSRATVIVLSTYEMKEVSNVEVADSIAIEEIHHRVATIGEQVQVMESQAVQVVSGLKEIETIVQQ